MVLLVQCLLNDVARIFISEPFSASQLPVALAVPECDTDFQVAGCSLSCFVSKQKLSFFPVVWVFVG